MCCCGLWIIQEKTAVFSGQPESTHPSQHSSRITSPSSGVGPGCVSQHQIRLKCSLVVGFLPGRHRALGHSPRTTRNPHCTKTFFFYSPNKHWPLCLPCPAQDKVLGSQSLLVYSSRLQERQRERDSDYQVSAGLNLISLL